MKTGQRVVLGLAILCPFGLCPSAMGDEHDAGRGNKDAKIEGLLQVAAAYKADRDLPKTQEYLAKVLELDGNNVRAGAELAWVCNEKKQFEKAALLAVTTLKVDNTCEPAWRELGYALLMTKDYGKAVQALEHAIDIEPADADAQTYLDQARKERTATPRAGRDW